MANLIRLLAAIGFMALVAPPVAAQYPAKPVRLVVPFAAGGAADLVARVLAQPLSQTLGQPVIVENRPGADGAIAGNAVAKSSPDGYTLLFGSNTGMVATPLLQKNPPYDSLADFTPISLISQQASLLVMHSSVPAKTLPELMAYARANPGKLSYGTSTSSAVLATAQLMAVGKLDMVHIPYKGEASALPDLLTGRVQLMFVNSFALVIPEINSGKLRALAVGLDARSSLLPDVPTITESGLPKLTIVPWFAVFGPANMPPDIVQRLSRELASVLKRQEVRDLLNKTAAEPKGSTSDELKEYLKDQIVIWDKAIRDAGIQRQ